MRQQQKVRMMMRTWALHSRRRSYTCREKKTQRRRRHTFAIILHRRATLNELETVEFAHCLGNAHMRAVLVHGDCGALNALCI